MSSLPLPIAAFFAGLISFLSPCVLPLVPGYVSLISGAGVEELKAPQGQLMRRVMVNSIGFILGFSVVFIALGATATEIGQVLGIYKHTLARVAGVVIILFGLHLTGIFKIKALYTDARLHSVKGSSTPDRRVRDRLRVCFRLDSLSGADSDGDPRPSPASRTHWSRELPSAGSLFAGAGGAVSC